MDDMLFKETSRIALVIAQTKYEYSENLKSLPWC
jgi:hypothetical protein